MAVRMNDLLRKNGVRFARGGDQHILVRNDSGVQAWVLGAPGDVPVQRQIVEESFQIPLTRPGGHSAQNLAQTGDGLGGSHESPNPASIYEPPVT